MSRTLLGGLIGGAACVVAAVVLVLAARTADRAQRDAEARVAIERREAAVVEVRAREAARPPWEQECPAAVTDARDERYGPALRESVDDFVRAELDALRAAGDAMGPLRTASRSPTGTEADHVALGCAQRRHMSRARQLLQLIRYTPPVSPSLARAVPFAEACVAGTAMEVAEMDCHCLDRMRGVPIAPIPTEGPVELRQFIVALRAGGDARWLAALASDELDAAVQAWPDRDIPYTELERAPDAHVGVSLVLEGRVEEIHDTATRGVSTMRVALRSGGRDVVWVETSGLAPASSITAGARVVVVGYVAGSNTYETVAGWRVTLPAVLAAGVFRE